jgi:hypothetical protein
MPRRSSGAPPATAAAGENSALVIGLRTLDAGEGSDRSRRLNDPDAALVRFGPSLKPGPRPGAAVLPNPPLFLCYQGAADGHGGDDAARWTCPLRA